MARQDRSNAVTAPRIQPQETPVRRDLRPTPCSRTQPQARKNFSRSRSVPQPTARHPKLTELEPNIDAPKLNRPPIEEVVCGFTFAALPVGLLEFGIYWDQRRADFPRHEEHPAILDASTFQLSTTPPMRTWFVGSNEELLLQLQSDRFYTNWRRQEGEYPRFSDRDGKQGLLSVALREFVAFGDFCEAQCGLRPVVSRLELTKIDVLRLGLDYVDLDDLGALLPTARVLKSVEASKPTQLHLRLVEPPSEDHLSITMNIGPDAARIETRYTFNPKDDLRRRFEAANLRVNQVFFGLLNTKEMGRFTEKS